ncbi:hypothetical protein [Actinomadura xylanilytica]|uniref:hypothetical protein n=1 Tax=Actinomadura xylanilytica TaxID=887459 RepID=UPI00255B2C06|nr:hypothetical protein [Actinomadura xylanilytica]MDL4776249.1 hypothetical protein [Actinomadura xylanilytica]
MLAGEGRRDIPRAAFDNGAPIRLDLGTSIVEFLQVTRTGSASATPAPPVRAEGAALPVGPALIGRRQRIMLTALVEGEPELSCEARRRSGRPTAGPPPGCRAPPW